MLINIWSTENENSLGRNINDLELNLRDSEDVLRFFKALDQNYMIKTLRLHTSKSLGYNKKIEEVADQFRDKRIATEIWLNSGIKRFRDSKNKCFEVFYPEIL